MGIDVIIAGDGNAVAVVHQHGFTGNMAAVALVHVEGHIAEAEFTHPGQGQGIIAGLTVKQA